MANSTNGDSMAEGIYSLLDTDLYKLTMQCAILKYFPKVHVAYSFTNRTPQMKLTRAAYNWLKDQIHKLSSTSVSDEEITWLKKTCPYLCQEYLDFLKKFRLKPVEQVKLSFEPESDCGDDAAAGTLSLAVYALVSEAYFKFVDRDWNRDKQVENAREKALKLLENGCVFSEFGSRRRRDYRTHEMVMQGLTEAQKVAESNFKGWTGKFTGTSNAHFAMRFGVAPIGTVAHEWFMGIAAITKDYANANELAMQYWTGTFGRGVLAIALTDTFGTPAFLKAFVKPAAKSGTTEEGDAGKDPTYAQIFTGVRQDSGDPLEYLQTIKNFYQGQGITDKKVIVFSDSLNVEKCIKYRDATVAAGLTPSFGVGTFFTNDFIHASKNEKSVPMNIVIKLSEAGGTPAVKLSDNQAKNTGDSELIKQVKKVVGYEEKEWREGDEAHRWDK
ncbi:nicotinate phosphoribosyltransferase [Extremus antarcticus]|uniref:Nicotinate phosphoribosyltransferase n=1 Tax=Extremus antarcticus TaxID=702011 RepID=A0AAJ0GHX3_9PEZI|nr:nicotinate phosphoribosyltransferase [Extremus antarcticus]